MAQRTRVDAANRHRHGRRKSHHDRERAEVRDVAVADAGCFSSCAGPQAPPQPILHHVFCSFAMCTDEADVVELYNKVVDPIFGCDITDDYAAECREAKRVGNALSPFQWLAKMLLVKYDKYDALDERKLDGRRRACCALS